MIRRSALSQFLGNLVGVLDSVLPAKFSFPVDGKTYDGPGLIALLEKINQPFADVDSAKRKWDDAVAAREAATPEAKRVAEIVAKGLEFFFAGNSEALAKLGVEPTKARRQLTLEEKVAKAAKAQATRALRGTKGPRQKAAIKATGPLPAPAPAPSATPAPSGGDTTASSPPPTQVNGAAH